MAWKLKKEWEGKSLANIRTPLDQLTQKQINTLSDKYKELLFIEDKPKEDKPKRKKRDVSI
tara:strand:- start:916 stop:1098 length:183 start_codon:yes stop_codon:yes gene_type:complete